MKYHESQRVSIWQWKKKIYIYISIHLLHDAVSVLLFQASSIYKRMGKAFIEIHTGYSWVVWELDLSQFKLIESISLIWAGKHQALWSFSSFGQENKSGRYGDGEVKTWSQMLIAAWAVLSLLTTSCLLVGTKSPGDLRAASCTPPL